MNIPKSLNLRMMLIATVLLYMGAIVFGSLFLGESKLFDGYTLVLSLGMGLAFFVALRFSRGHLFTQVAIIYVFMLMHVYPRIASYLLVPDTVIFPFGGAIGASTINIGLLYILSGTVLFLVGMRLADVTLKPTNKHSVESTSDSSMYPTRIVVILFLFVAAIQLYATLVIGISPYGKMRAENHNVLIQLIKTIYELDSAFFFVLATLILKSAVQGKRELKAMALVLFFYVCTTSVGGSRAAILRIVIAFIVSLLVIKDEARIKLFKLGLVTCLLAVLALAIYPLATANRVLINTRSLEELGGENYAEEYAVDATEDLRTSTGLVGSAMNRLGIVDYPILIVTQDGNPIAMKKYMNITYPIKQIINQLMPGTVYDDAKIMTSRVVNTIYRQGAETGMYHGYFSEFWTIWGLTFVYLGWGGGLLVMFLLGFLVHALYAGIIIMSSGMKLFYLRIWYLFYVTMGLFSTMGIDSSFVTIVFGLLQFGVLYYTLRFLCSASRMFKRMNYHILRA